jgi:hypothetical protein
MNRNTFVVDANPLPLRLPEGSVIFASRGEVWITQEGMFDDVILGPGERFDVKSPELILASATRGSGYLVVAQPAQAAESAARDLITFLLDRARQHRVLQFGRAVQAARRLLSGLGGTSVHVRRGLVLSPRSQNR